MIAFIIKELNKMDHLYAQDQAMDAMTRGFEQLLGGQDGDGKAPPTPLPEDDPAADRADDAG